MAQICQPMVLPSQGTREGCRQSVGLTECRTGAAGRKVGKRAHSRSHTPYHIPILSEVGAFFVAGTGLLRHRALASMGRHWWGDGWQGGGVCGKPGPHSPPTMRLQPVTTGCGPALHGPLGTGRGGHGAPTDSGKTSDGRGAAERKKNKWCTPQSPPKSPSRRGARGGQQKPATKTKKEGWWTIIDNPIDENLIYKTDTNLV